MENKIITTSIPTIKRLPRYIQILKKLKSEKVENVSATMIGDELGIESIQVRKDLSTTGIVGKPKVGYQLDELLTTLVNFLNWNNKTDAFLVGTGALGKAILGYDNFKNYGLNIIAAFDNDPEKIKEKINSIEVFHIDKLKSLAERMKIRIGVITVPVDYAQEIAEIMVSGGIKAVWNFAPVDIKLPEEIIVENVHLSQSLAVLTHKLSNIDQII